MVADCGVVRKKTKHTRNILYITGNVVPQPPYCCSFLMTSLFKNWLDLCFFVHQSVHAQPPNPTAELVSFAYR